MNKVVALGALIVLAVVSSYPAMSADFTIKLAYVAQATNPLHKGMEYFAQKVQEKSNGRIEVKLFNSEQLGGERDYIEGLQLGTIEMAQTSIGPLGSFEPAVNLFSLPFLIRSAEHFNHVFDGPMAKKVAEKLLPKGLRILGYTDSGARYLYNSKRMIHTPEDMKGLKFRSIENPVFVETYKALGGRAVPMARPEVFSALKQGVIDGLDNSLAFYESTGDYEVAKYLTLGFELFQTPGALIVSEKFYQSLPADLQAVLQDAANEAIPYQRKVFREAEAATLTRLKAKGVVTETADLKLFEPAAKSVWGQFADKVGGQALIDAVVETK
jgi:tripartite ATP-independent transporter DctP family solute receptor